MKGKLPVKKNLADDSVLARYLLGEASGDEQTLVERRYFTEPDFYEQLLAVEDDLLDAYVRGELSPEQKAQFENHFTLSPRRRERLGFAEALRLRAAPASPPAAPASPPAARAAWRQSLLDFFQLKRPVVGFALASLVVVALLAGLWFVSTVREARRTGDVARVEPSRVEPPANRPPQTSPSAETPAVEKPQNTPDASQQQPPPAKPRQSDRQNQSSSQAKPSPSATVAFALVPNLLRDDAELRNLIVPRNAAQLRLQLSIETGGAYSSYHAELRRLGGAQIFRRAIRRPAKSRAGQTIVLTIPAKLLANGDYMLTLTGTPANREAEVIGDYPFTIVRK